MNTLNKEIAGWGRYPVQRCELVRPERHADLLSDAPSLLARGQGRSYGDAALNEGRRVVLTERVNRFLAFDCDQGIVRAEAGATLAELLTLTVPRGWFPLVTPGTKHVSLGGCVAADVHGKNHHHDGAFSRSVRELELITADGRRLCCSAQENGEAFRATVGGMGLTGIIGEVELQLQPIESVYIRARHQGAANLEQVFALLQDTDNDARYSVAWLDLMSRGAGLGRGVVMNGDHAARDELSGGRRLTPLRLAPAKVRNIPFDMPGWLLNSLSIRAFNAQYFRREGGRSGSFLVDYDSFFYPLDTLDNWNRLYGKRGFVQYQCVVPTATALEAMQQLLRRLADSGHPAFLGVLKRMGAAGEGYLSFPMEGYTLAMDLPMKGVATLALLDAFDAIVLQHGGRVYLAKDARLAMDSFRAMYPQLDAWRRVRRELDPQGVFGSSLSRRLGMEGEA
jgi:FAD/FMN-containing dehydrogenase